MKKTLLILTMISVILGSVIFVIYKNNQNDKEEVVEIFKEDTKEQDKKEENTSIKKITVDIKGMVNNPGVYEVDSESRVNDVIALAGGLKEGADTSNINLAKIVSDEMTIIVYSTEEVLEKFKQEVCICNCPYIVNDACIGEDGNDNNNLININTASVEELTTLTGIGDVKAEAIIKYRNEVGKFKTKEEILNVDGIGESLFEKIKGDITV